MNNKKEEAYQDILHFLRELRTRLIYFLIVLFIIFAVVLYFADRLYTLFALPLLKFLPQGHLIATQIMSPFLVPFKLALMTSMLLTMPFFLYQLWMFIAPALYGHERRLVWPFLLVSTLLFYLGIAFAYFGIFPLLFHFLTRIVPEGVMLNPDMGDYLDVTMKLMLMFGGLFEIPIIMVLCVLMGVVTRQRLINIRSYAIVSAFILGMLLAPPDVVSQTIVALPIWLLYEVGILMTRFVRKQSSC